MTGLDELDGIDDKTLFKLKDAILNMFQYMDHHVEYGHHISDAVNGPIGKTVRILIFERDIKIIKIALEVALKSL